jgi:hypothetical protein
MRLTIFQVAPILRHGCPVWGRLAGVRPAAAKILETLILSGSKPMAERQIFRLQSGRFAAALAVSLLTFVGRAHAQNSAPPLPAAGTPAPSFSELVGSPSPPPPLGPMTARQPTYFPAAGAVPPRVPVETGFFDTISESLFGQTDADSWRPLPLSTLFSEGWNEAWVPSPSGSGGAPRQGWINAADGNLYRLWFFTFAQAFNSGPKSNAYLGAWTVFAPLNRRLDLIINVPFVVQNNTASGLPIINPTGQSQGFKRQTTFGDMSFTPRVLLHETKDFSLTAETSVLVPTGRQPLEGKTSLTPAMAFWYNFAGRWVVRGGIGDLIPVGNGGKDTLISQLAIGQTLTDHDVPLFGDFTWYVSAVVDTPLARGQHTGMTLTPGTRTHLGNNWYFLAGLPTPVTSQRIGELGMIFWFMKAW